MNRSIPLVFALVFGLGAPHLAHAVKPVTQQKQKAFDAKLRRKLLVHFDGNEAKVKNALGLSEDRIQILKMLGENGGSVEKVVEGERGAIKAQVQADFQKRHEEGLGVWFGKKFGVKPKTVEAPAHLVEAAVDLYRTKVKHAQEAGAPFAAINETALFKDPGLREKLRDVTWSFSTERREQRLDNVDKTRSELDNHFAGKRHKEGMGALTKQIKEDAAGWQAKLNKASPEQLLDISSGLMHEIIASSTSQVTLKETTAYAKSETSTSTTGNYTRTRVLRKPVTANLKSESASSSESAELEILPNEELHFSVAGNGKMSTVEKQLAGRVVLEKTFRFIEAQGALAKVSSRLSPAQMAKAEQLRSFLERGKMKFDNGEPFLGNGPITIGSLKTHVDSLQRMQLLDKERADMLRAEHLTLSL